MAWPAWIKEGLGGKRIDHSFDFALQRVPLDRCAVVLTDAVETVRHFCNSIGVKKVPYVTDEDREVRRKLKILEYAKQIGDVSKTCQYFGVGRASFYRWKKAFEQSGEAGPVPKRSGPHNHPNKTPKEVEDKVLYLRKSYHLGPKRIV